jgi:hypothetical protein
MAIFKDLRPSTRFAGNLSEIADWMAGHVLRAPVVEADTGFAIRVLRDAVSYITASVKQLRGKELEDIFGGKSVFENILQYEEGRYPLEEMRQAATYLLVNQLLFYHVLSRVDASFPAVDEEKIRRPSDLMQYFEPVLRRDYSSVFGFDVASRLPEDATDVVKKVVMVVKALAPEKIRHDLLGKVFHELIPFEVRKAVAAFYTNNEAAEILAQLAIDKPDAKVVDLAVGSGTLLVAAYRRKRELLQKVKGTIELEDHKRFLEQDLTGIDIMPFAAHLAVVHLSLQALLYETEKVRVAVWDSTELKPGQIIPAIWSELKTAYRRPTLDMFAKGGPPEEAYVTKGTVTMERIGGEKIPLEQADLIIMNPPFTRQERLPKEYKEALAKRFSEYEDYLHGQLGLYGHFVFLADRFAKVGGRIALVLPSTLLRIRSAKGVRKFLAENYCIEYIITTWQRAAFSESAKFREILLIARKGAKKNDISCSVINIKKIPKSVEEAKVLAEKIKITRHGNMELDDDDMTLFFVPQEELRKEIQNWFIYISTYNLQTLRNFRRIIKAADGKLTPFSFEAQEFDLRDVKIGRVHGFVLRYQNRAKKPLDRWYASQIDSDSLVAVDRITNEQIKIPLSMFSPGLRSSSGVNTIDVSDEADFLVMSKFEKMKTVYPDIDERVLEKWRKKIKERAANLLIARRFVLPAPGLSAVAFYSSRPLVGVDLWSIKKETDEDARILALWFNSTINLLQVYTLRALDTWMKIHDYTLKEFLILNLTKLEREKLLELFDEVKSTALPSIFEQLKQKNPMRRKIDAAVLKVLGFNGNEIDDLLNELYPLLVDEFERLKIFMKSK